MGVYWSSRGSDEPIEMSCAKIIRFVFDEWFRRAFLALLLVGALLLCHGAYGVSHQVFSALHAEQPHHSHVPHTEHADAHGVGVAENSMEHQGGDLGGHLGHVAYAAALLTISLGAVLWLLSGARTWTRNGLLSLPGRVLSPVFLRPLRRSSLPLLQVFRL